MSRLSSVEVQRLAAFTVDGKGGNPAGVVICEAHPAELEMQQLAAEVGYSETAFLEPFGGQAWRVRYFSPKVEVPFCGHATIASAVALSQRFGVGDFILETRTGPVPVTTRAGETGEIEATLVSPMPSVAPAEADLVGDALTQLRWSAAELDPSLPPAVSFAGARHLILAAGTRDRLRQLDYDFDGLRELMVLHGLFTVDLVWRESPLVFHARNPFPVGGVVEDPATGGAAAAFGAYLRFHRFVTPPARITIFQGADIGRPSRLNVELVAGDERVRISGTASPIEPAETASASG